MKQTEILKTKYLVSKIQITNIPVTKIARARVRVYTPTHTHRRELTTMFAGSIP